MRDILAADHLAVGKIGGLVPLDLRIQPGNGPLNSPPLYPYDERSLAHLY
ncbi:MAG: hypothetical protein ACM33U_12400 [Solirubrobacterales bacterium]